ncbi:hypothetical protein FQA47_018333 [Oryzias melastigma]|uniref:Uncharacterized protein n=1 Tax=Oryzias melastigma TaxID=30732 RepID=A0A834L309_ORYME|nr:hypothetical protein FQA47_018333 [Oryzias melastigma]
MVAQQLVPHGTASELGPPAPPRAVLTFNKRGPAPALPRNGGAARISSPDGGAAPARSRADNNETGAQLAPPPDVHRPSARRGSGLHRNRLHTPPPNRPRTSESQRSPENFVHQSACRTGHCGSAGTVQILQILQILSCLLSGSSIPVLPVGFPSRSSSSLLQDRLYKACGYLSSDLSVKTRVQLTSS